MILFTSRSGGKKWGYNKPHLDMDLNLHLHTRFFLKARSIVFILLYGQTLEAAGLNTKVKKYTLANKNTMHYHEQAMEDESSIRREGFWKKIVEYRKERAKHIVLMLLRSRDQYPQVSRTFLSKSLSLPTYREQANSIEAHINTIL